MAYSLNEFMKSTPDPLVKKQHRYNCYKYHSENEQNIDRSLAAIFENIFFSKAAQYFEDRK